MLAGSRFQSNIEPRASMEFLSAAPYDASLPPPLYETIESESMNSAGTESGFNSPSLRSTAKSYSSSIGSSESTELAEKGDDLEESLPSYTPALTKMGILQMKPELSSPFCRANRRNWRTVLVEVNNTQLRLTQTDWVGLNMFKRKTTYSLQFAEIGLASDYHKRNHCFRLRVETKQFVFDCRSRPQMLSWMISLQMGISLALPLELRQMPEDIKRRRHRRGERRWRQRRERNTEDNYHHDHEHHQQHRNGETASAEHNTASRRSRSQTQNSTGSDSDLERPSTLMRLTRTFRSETQNVPRKKHEDYQVQVKWHPPRRHSRYSEKDFPHLFVDTTWEGKNVLYRGHWAIVQDQKIMLIIGGVPELPPAIA